MYIFREKISLYMYIYRDVVNAALNIAVAHAMTLPFSF